MGVQKGQVLDGAGTCIVGDKTDINIYYFCERQVADGVPATVNGATGVIPYGWPSLSRHVNVVGQDEVGVLALCCGLCPLQQAGGGLDGVGVVAYLGAFLQIAASAFFRNGTVATELEQAQSLLTPLLGNNAAVIFAVALLFAGISSTLTSGMAAGSIFAGIYREPYDIKDRHSKVGVILSIVLALCVIMLISNPFNGLIYSQMALSVQLPVTIFTQVYLTSREKVMGKYKNSAFTKYLLYTIGAIVTLLNIALLVSLFH